MSGQTIRDRLWLWGMKVNALQETDSFGSLGFATSTMTTEDAIAKTGITNVVMAGGLSIDEESLAALPSATRIICKTSIHGEEGLKADECLATLRDAKRLAAADPRIEAFHLDDFSTGSIDHGVTPEHITQFQLANATEGPHLVLGATLYTMSLRRPELPALLPAFAHFLVPLWHSDQIDGVPADLDHLARLSGGKPMLLCLYAYDFGNGKHISRELMTRHLDLAERLILEQRVSGMLLCGTCMMDLDWEATHCYHEWVERVADRPL